MLENVSVVMDAIEGDDVFEEINTIPLRNMPLGQAGSTFVVFALTKVRRFWHSSKMFSLFEVLTVACSLDRRVPISLPSLRVF